ncbi:hypothetical protein NKG05_02980 [Oerskovia sp. M15]
MNAGRFAVSEGTDGQMTSSSIDPDFHDEREDEFDPRSPPTSRRCSTRAACGGAPGCWSVTPPRRWAISRRPSTRR